MRDERESCHIKLYFQFPNYHNVCVSARRNQPGEEILREVLSRLHPASITGSQGELVAQQLSDHLQRRHLAVAVQWESEVREVREVRE